MKKQREQFWVWPVLLAISLLLQTSCGSNPSEPAKSAEQSKPLAAPNPACTLPATMASSNEQTAWQIFVAANCAANGQLTWETWTEQTCWVDPSSPGCPSGGATGAATAKPVRRLHGSRLGSTLRRGTAGFAQSNLPSECNPMTTSGPFAPKNLSAKPVFCEEVHVDPSESTFVTQPAAGQKLTTVVAQAAYAATNSGVINFPVPAVEIKADWIPASSLATPFDCANNKPAGVYVETIDSTCYALVGLHLSSKLLPNWLWATFEPQNKDTNPNRCNPNLYDSCNDPWGSNPATSTGQTTDATAALAALMKAANLPDVFSNYRLVGVQTDFVDSAKKPIHLGNSFVEFNAGVPPHKASCMTCHSSAMILAGPPPTQKGCCLVAIGNPPAPPPKAISQDFSWMLGIMPAQ
ncbi:MAG: hypothetical protein ACLQU1_35470 [Bryobacteraceae bacterium]